MSAPTLPPFDPSHIQGDILCVFRLLSLCIRLLTQFISAGLPKKVQQYVLFQIDDDVTQFRKRLALLIPLITTTNQVMADRAKIAANKKAAQEAGKVPQLLKLSGINIAFSHAGLEKVRVYHHCRLDREYAQAICAARYHR